VTEFNVADVWEALVAADPDHLALVFRDRRFTRAMLNDRAGRLAGVLASRRLGHCVDRSTLAGWESGQDHLAIYLHNGNEYLEAMLGAFKARLAPFNVNYRYVAQELQYLLADSSTRAIVYHSAFAPTLAVVLPNLPLLTTLLQVQDDSGQPLLPGAVWYEDALAAATEPTIERSPDDLYILYTGGTTGSPKGVLWRQGDAFCECFGGSRRATSLEDVVARATTPVRAILSPPFMHGAAHWVAFTTWHRGGTVFIQDTPERLIASEIWDLVERERITLLLIVGDAFARPLLDEFRAHPRDGSSLTTLLSGGAAMSAGVKQQFLDLFPGLTIIDGLGSSEVGTQLQHLSSGDNASTGRFPLSDTAAILSHDLTRELQPGDAEIGWLAKRGPRLALGYLGDEEKTSQTYPVIDGKRFGVPGDKARIDAEGLVQLFGRESATINSGGEKIFAEEVEAAIKAHPAVYDCVVTGRPSERWGSEVVAIVHLRSQTTEASLTAEAAKHIARYKLPKAYVFVDAIHRSPAGKPDYRWAKDQAAKSISED
jgi:3-oxocholest-4-en-26-oate---CoA ligase